jgi:hypothetical protein
MAPGTSSDTLGAIVFARHRGGKGLILRLNPRGM